MNADFRYPLASVLRYIAPIQDPATLARAVHLATNKFEQIGKNDSQTRHRVRCTIYHLGALLRDHDNPDEMIDLAATLLHREFLGKLPPVGMVRSWLSRGYLQEPAPKNPSINARDSFVKALD